MQPAIVEAGPIPPEDHRDPPPALAEVEHRWVDLPNRCRLHVAETGEGPAVLLVHGWPGHWWCWRDVMPLLREAGRRVIAVDLRGFGWSEAPAGGYRKDQLADDLAALVDQEGLGQLDLISHDWGGVVGHHLCVRRPDLVRRHVTFNTGHLWISPRAAWRLWPLYTYQWAFMGPIVWRWGPAAACRMIGRWAGWSCEASEVYASRLVQRERARATRELYRTFFLHEVWELVRGSHRGVALEVPTLQLHGVGDPVIRAEAFEAFRGDPTAWRFERLPGLAHFPPEEDAALAARRALEWLTLENPLAPGTDV